MLLVIGEGWARDNDVLRWDSGGRHGLKRMCESVLDTERNFFWIEWGKTQELRAEEWQYQNYMNDSFFERWYVLAEILQKN